MFRSASLFIGTSFTVAIFTIFATSNVDSIVAIPHKIYSMQRILIHIKSRSLCWMCPSAPMVCSEPGGQKPVLSLSLDLIELIDENFACNSRFVWGRQQKKLFKLYMFTWGITFVRTVDVKFTNNLPIFPIVKSLWSCLKLLLLTCLLELSFGFENSLLSDPIFRKSLCYRSLDRIECNPPNNLPNKWRTVSLPLKNVLKL